MGYLFAVDIGVADLLSQRGFAEDNGAVSTPFMQNSGLPDSDGFNGQAFAVFWNGRIGRRH